QAEQEARAEAEAEAHRVVEETQLRAEEEMRKRREEAEARLKEAEARLLADQEACAKAEEEAHRLAEELRTRTEAEQRRRAEAEARLREEEALLQAEQEAREKAEAEAQRVAEARSEAEAEAQRLAAEANIRAEEVAQLRFQTSERVKEEEARLQAEQEARVKAEAEAERLVEETRARAAEEARLRVEAEARVQEEEARLAAEQQARLKAEEDAQRLIEETRIKAEAEARRRAEVEAGLQEEQERRLREQLAQEQDLEPTYQVEAIESENFAPETSWVDVSMAHDEHVAELSVVDEPSPIEISPTVAEIHQPAKAIDVLMAEKGIVFADDDAGIPSEILERLSSPESTEREAALGELVAIGGDDAFRCITRAFDDPVVDVRNAAAQALFALQPDRAASFTRALREGTPDRRRKIGHALASSGLAANAVGHLTGESREKTYDAFSLLFLMAKAGEVQPLMQAIEDYPNVEVRIAVVKLLALSGQPDIVPAFRRMAVRGSLPSEVRSAVMEAIYQIGNQARESAPSAA